MRSKLYTFCEATIYGFVAAGCQGLATEIVSEANTPLWWLVFIIFLTLTYIMYKYVLNYRGKNG